MIAPGEQARKAQSMDTEASTSAIRRAPKAFLIAPEHAAGAGSRDPQIEDEPDFTHISGTPDGVPINASSSGSNWLARVFWAALGTLVSFYFMDAGWDLILRLGAKSPVLGQVALGLAGLLVLALLFYLGRELFSILRMRRIQHIRTAVQLARSRASHDDTAQVLRLLQDFYAADPSTASARAKLVRMKDDVLDPLTRLDMIERELLTPKDEVARQLIAEAARRVSMVTALSPRAMIDVIFVLTQSVLMIRRLSTLYGGRAGGTGLWRLTARILAHLAVTGGVGMADSVIGQVLGAGLAARLSAKLGEGVLNGILTARVGIAALDYCRPMDFVACTPVLLPEVVKSIVTREKIEEKPAA